GVFGAHIPPVPGLVGDLGHSLGGLPLGIAEDEAVVPGVLAQPVEGGGVLKAGLQGGELGAVQVGGQAAVVLRVAGRVDDVGRHFPGGGLVVALVQELLGLVVVKGGLVLDAAVAALHPDGDPVGGGRRLHLQESVGGLGLQGLVDGGGRAALLGVEGIVLG